MRKNVSFSRSCFVTGVACCLALLAVADRSARAEIITYTIDANGIPITLPTPGGATSTSSSFSSAELTTLNSLLAADGSAYRFSALGGSSNFPGASTGGILSLSGIITVGATGSTSLTLTETETGFISPSGVPGTLASSSGGTFNLAGTGNSHSADSSFNAITTPTYTVASSSSTGPNSATGFASAPIPAFTTPYALNNFISFSLNLSTPGANDAFGVTAKATAIPEPASVVTMLIGLPLPLVGLAWLRRRKRV